MGWIGVDLDGTLAKYGGMHGPDVGEPIMPMVNRVLDLLNAGNDVRIFTARACEPSFIPPIKEWCIKHLGRELPVTNQKDFSMIEFYDDRAIQVEFNTGKLIGHSVRDMR